MLCCMLLVLIVSVQLGLSHRLDPRSDLTSRDIRLRCCYNHWSECCKIYPWEGPGRDDDEDTGSASGSGSSSGSGSGSGDLQYSKECKKYNTAFYGNYYGDKCVNSFVLFRDVRRARNIIAQLYRCSVKKDEVFYKALMKVEQNLRPDGERCCVKHAEDGILYEVAYSINKLSEDLKMLQEDYKLHKSLPWVPCYLYGHALTIEYKMSQAIWSMGIYIFCGIEGACPL